jgi:hypothetical protein
MSDKELVKRLRASRAVWEDGRSHPTDDEAEAADRIEALTAELAKAVVLGDKMAKSIEGNYYTPGLVGEWRTTLAEIEGSDDP